MFGIQYAHLQRGEHVIHTICNRTHNLKKINIMNYGKYIGALLLALVLTGCSRKKEALQVVDRFMLCAKDSVEKCKGFYPAYESLNVNLNYEKYAIDLHPTTSGDTVKVKAQLLKHDEFGFKHVKDVVFNVLPTEDKQLKIVSSQGLMEYSKTPILYALAQKTGAMTSGETDAQLKAKFSTLKEMSKDFLADFDSKVTIVRTPGSFWGWHFNRLEDSRFHLTIDVTINNKLGMTLRNVVVHAQALAGLPAWTTLCTGSKTLPEVPQGVSKYVIETCSKKIPDDQPRYGDYALKSLSVELPADAQLKYVENHEFKGDEYQKYIANKK